MSYTLTPYKPMQLQNAATTGNGGILYIAGHCERLTIIVQGAGTITAGTLLVEEAYYDKDKEAPFAGTWSIVQSVTLTTVTAGAQVAFHIVGSFWAIRARFSVNVTGAGGAVSVWAWGN